MSSRLSGVKLGNSGLNLDLKQHILMFPLSYDSYYYIVSLHIHTRAAVIGTHGINAEVSEPEFKKINAQIGQEYTLLFLCLIPASLVGVPRIARDLAGTALLQQEVRSTLQGFPI